jgi:hypothetical protein
MACSGSVGQPQPCLLGHQYPVRLLNRASLSMMMSWKMNDKMLVLPQSEPVEDLAERIVRSIGVCQLSKHGCRSLKI